MTLDDISKDYPYVTFDGEHFDISLDPISHIYATPAEMNFIISEYNRFINNEEYPNRTGDDDMDNFICPTCNNVVGYLDDFTEEQPNYCSRCGQRLTWKNAYNRGKIVRKTDDDN